MKILRVRTVSCGVLRGTYRYRDHSIEVSRERVGADWRAEVRNPRGSVICVARWCDSGLRSQLDAVLRCRLVVDDALRETRAVPCTWVDGDTDSCPACSGEVCHLCLAGFSGGPIDCEHDVTERHTGYVYS